MWRSEPVGWTEGEGAESGRSKGIDVALDFGHVEKAFSLSAPFSPQSDSLKTYSRETEDPRSSSKKKTPRAGEPSDRSGWGVADLFGLTLLPTLNLTFLVFLASNGRRSDSNLRLSLDVLFQACTREGHG